MFFSYLLINGRPPQDYLPLIRFLYSIALRLFYDYRWNKIIDAESGMDDAESGMDDAESGMNDAESGMDDAESGMDDAESGMDDIKYKHCAQQTPQNYLQKFRFLWKENDFF